LFLTTDGRVVRDRRSDGVVFRRGVISDVKGGALCSWLGRGNGWLAEARRWRGVRWGMACARMLSTRRLRVQELALERHVPQHMAEVAWSLRGLQCLG